MTKIRTLIENNFALCLVFFAALGLFLPSFGDYSDKLVIIFVAGLVYFSGPSIKIKEMLDVDIFQIGTFTLLRYAILPIIFFYIAQLIVPDYAVGILLLTLMPAAMAVASLCAISSSKVALGLSITLISSLLTPLFVPAVFSFLGHYVEVNTISLFVSLLLVVIVPLFLYFGPTVRFNVTKNWVTENAKMMSIILMALILYVVVSSYRTEFLENIDMLLKGTFIMFVVFFLCYLFGYVFGFFVPKEQRSTYIIASGTMNNGLAIGVSFLYFSAEITFFIMISEIVWSFYVAASQYYFSKQKKI